MEGDSKYNVSKILVCCRSLTLGGAQVVTSDAVRVLGVLLTSDLSFDKHVTAVSVKCFYQLRQLRRIRRSLDDDSADTLVMDSLIDRFKEFMLWSTRLSPAGSTTAAVCWSALRRRRLTSCSVSSMLPIMMHLDSCSMNPDGAVLHAYLYFIIFLHSRLLFVKVFTLYGATIRIVIMFLCRLFLLSNICMLSPLFKSWRTRIF